MFDAAAVVAELPESAPLGQCTAARATLLKSFVPSVMVGHPI